MRSTFTFLFTLFTSFAFAQNSIKASEIIRQLNDGQAVMYKNVEIEGQLDFTNLKNRRLANTSFGFFNMGNDAYESTVEASLVFVNCTFQDDVVAYNHVDRDGDTFIAHFEMDVVFQNCTFRRKSEFKYSEFEEEADFGGSTFHREANFKYAEFSGSPVFANVNFRDDANFKYAEFPRGVNFESAVFEQLANFKYTKFRTPLNIKNTSFQGEEDFKYTRVDGQSFTTYLLNNR